MSTLKVNNIQSVTDGVVSFPQGLSSSNEPLSIPDGTASSPSIRFGNDTDTGLYRIGANTIGIASNGTRVGEIGNGYGGFTGNVIQVVQGFSNARFAISNTSNFVQASNGVSIIPKYSTSKILVTHYLSYQIANNGAFLDFGRQIGGGTITQNISGFAYGLVAPFSSSSFDIGTVSYLDSPNTTNQITYYLSVKVSGGTFYSVSYGNSNEYNPFILMEIQQ